ncbi:MAG: hypothetical protein JWR23_75 [Mucilaginibacter sp.]|nr:hypothetical protein [Mucilaginibacter sp.]
MPDETINKLKIKLFNHNGLAKTEEHLINKATFQLYGYCTWHKQ